jgi:hypothetical protein
MPKNYLIGIGGTGARVIEAAVNLCATGYGPAELSIFIVDPDSGNGNLTRTKNLISNYIKCRKSLNKTDNTNIFKTDIKIPPDEKGLVWEIFNETGATLSNFINYKNMVQTKTELAEFASILFTEKELNTELNEGFRGHPSIGSVVMANPPQDRYPFKMLFDDLAANKKPNDVRVFLVGSVFGGTGAAGFPTLGSKQILKYHPLAKFQDNISQILLGGALVLPYFSFDLDVEAQKTENMFVTTNDFPVATKAALQYYNEKDLGFDQIYFIGDSLAQKVGKFGVGAKKQENLPHYIEIVSSLAAFDFYEQPEIKGEADKMLFTATRESDKLRWSDLPITRDSSKISQKQKELKTLVTYMTVFSFSFLTYGKRMLNANHKDIKETWYLDYFKFNDKDEKEKIKDPRQKDSKEALQDFEKFLKNFIFWISAIDDDSGKVELIDKKMLVNKELEVGKEISLINSEGETTKSNIGYLIKNEKENKGKDFNEFIKRGLNDVQFKDKKITDASSKFINIFYEAAIKYSKLNYNVN